MLTKNYPQGVFDWQVWSWHVQRIGAKMFQAMCSAITKHTRDTLNIWENSSRHWGQVKNTHIFNEAVDIMVRLMLLQSPSVAEKTHSIFVVEGAVEEERCPTDE